MIKLIDSVFWLAVVLTAGAGETWTWPESASSVRIATKVKFLDGDHDKSDRANRLHQADEPSFVPAMDTDGFYNRPPNSGRFPVRVETHQATYAGGKFYGQDDSDMIQYCKCVSTPECQPRDDSLRTCGVGKYLCCYKRSNRPNSQSSEFFNEIEDERPMLFPGRESFAKPFPPPDTTGLDEEHPSVLVGPGGPTGIVGHNKPNGARNPNVHRDIHSDETAQRGVLVGPGGPTGVIGPSGFGGRRPVLVGPGGPTGVIGPRQAGFFGYGRPGFGRQLGPGVLVGPSGPTGIIGPGRNILVGPGGPQGYYGK